MWYYIPTSPFVPKYFGAATDTYVYFNPDLNKYLWRGASPLATGWYISSTPGANIYMKSYPAGTTHGCRPMQRQSKASASQYPSYYCDALGLGLSEASHYIGPYPGSFPPGSNRGFKVIGKWCYGSSAYLYPAYFGCQTASIGNKGIATATYCMTADELDDFWVGGNGSGIITTDDGVAPGLATQYYLYSKYGLSPAATGWTDPAGYKAIVYDLVGIEFCATQIGVYSGGTVVGWKEVANGTGGTPLPVSFTERNTLSEGYHVFKGTIAMVDWYIWFDGADWIISSAVGDKSSFYWARNSLIGLYAYVQNGSPSVYPDVSITFTSYIAGAERGNILAAKVHCGGDQ